MRGVVSFLVLVFALFITIAIAVLILGVFNIFQPPNSGASPVGPSFYGTFDYSSYLLTDSPVDIKAYSSLDNDTCRKLKNAIKYAVLSGKPWKVDEIAYGSDLISDLGFPFIGNCSDEVIQTQIENGLNETICKFTKANTNVKVGDDNTYGGISDDAGLYYDNCAYDSDSNYVVTGNVGPSPEDINFNPNTINLYYSPDYFYIKNGDYSHPSGGINDNHLSNTYNGAGRLRIYVGNVTFKNDVCYYNIYFCPRPAIAKYKENSTTTIFEIFKDLELVDLIYFPYYVRDFTNSPLLNAKDMTGYTKSIYYWNFYEVQLDSDYRVETIINAIKSGLYEGVFGKEYFFDHPHWDIEYDNNINKNNDCWDNNNYNNMLASDSEDDRTRSIRFNCNGGVCSSAQNLTMRVAVRRDKKSFDINNDGQLENVTYVSGVFTFCDH